MGENASAASRQVATLATRKPKESDISQVELRQRWRSKADEIGLDREAIERTLGVMDPSERYPDITVYQLDRAVTEGQSHFDRRDAIQAVADSLRNGAQGADVERMADECREASAERQLRDMQERIERAERQIERYDPQRERAQELKRSFRKDELARIDRDEARSVQRVADLEGDARALPIPSGAARRELAVAERVLAERRELAIAAARISPPPYITKELGERPADPNKRWHWDRGVADIEQYRQRYGVKDRSRAFGPESKGSAERARQEQARRQLMETQRVLGLGQHKAKARALRRGLGLFR